MKGTKRHGKGAIDSPFTHFGPEPSLSSAPGSYDRHPNVGPASVDGGFPLKFTDDSVKTTKAPLKSGQEFTPAQTTKS